MDSHEELYSALTFNLLKSTFFCNYRHKYRDLWLNSLTFNLPYCDLTACDGEHGGLAVDDEVFRSDGGEIALLVGSTFILLAAGELATLVAAVPASFSWLPAISEQ